MKEPGNLLDIIYVNIDICADGTLEEKKVFSQHTQQIFKVIITENLQIQDTQ